MDTALTNTPSALLAARLQPLGRAAGQEDHRGALRGGLAQPEPGNGEILALVVDVVHAAGIDVHPGLPVDDDGVVLPRSLPQLVADLEVLRGDVVPLVVRNLLPGTEVAGGAVGVGGDQVPADAAVGQVVQGAVLAGQCVGVLVGGRPGHPEAQVLGDCGHPGDEQQRVVARGSARRRRVRRRRCPGRCRGSRRCRRRRCRRTGPLRASWRSRSSRQVLVPVALVLRVPPQAGRQMGGALEVESQQSHPVSH